MTVLPWVLVGILAVALIIIVVLWQQSKLAAEAAKDTLDDIDTALAQKSSSGLTSFADGAVFRLLAKGQINLSGKVHAFGVVQDEKGDASAFLTTDAMSALAGGDSFSSLQGKLHKVETTAPAAVTASPQSPTPAAPAAATVPPSTPPETEDEEDDGERTVMFIPTRDETPPEDPLAGFPNLLVHSGPDTGTRFPLPYKHATVGRDKNNVIALGDQGSSRLHCEIFYRNNEFVLQDANSTNGTLCNGESITEKVLEFGDRIQVSDTLMEFTAAGYESKDSDPNQATADFEKCLEREPNFLLALKNLAFLLERDVRRQKEADPLWKRISQLEQGR